MQSLPAARFLLLLLALVAVAVLAATAPFAEALKYTLKCPGERAADARSALHGVAAGGRLAPEIASAATTTRSSATASFNLA
ncbi:hypothetical protein DFJ73DRAFT_783532 [Zopfochytrium polystomum]|nr:hypothetical protein DFJ73DRAFT_783532 [Zopfochytrium polystomum]